MDMMESICVFCGSSDTVHSDYLSAAYSMGVTLADRGLRLIYGGGKTGLMGAVANGALSAGGEVIGVIIPSMNTPALAHDGLTRMDVPPDMHARKARMHELADGYIAMPGGFGTFDELFEILALRQTGKSPPIPIVLYDQKFWEEVVNFNALVKHGVISKVDETLFTYAETPEQAWQRCVDGGVMTRWLQEQHTT